MPGGNASQAKLKWHSVACKNASGLSQVASVAESEVAPMAKSGEAAVAKVSNADDDASRCGQYQHCVIHDKRTTHPPAQTHAHTHEQNKRTHARAPGAREAQPAAMGPCPQSRKWPKPCVSAEGPVWATAEAAKPRRSPTASRSAEWPQWPTKRNGTGSNSCWLMAKQRNACEQNGSDQCRCLTCLQWSIFSGCVRA